MASANGRHIGQEYVVLIGDVGSGKSTIVEKICGVSGRSSDSSGSFTKESKLFHSQDGRLVLADTPGSNALTDKIQHNCQIAVALNYEDVSRIIIVVKADTRIDNVVHGVRVYAEQLLDLDSDVLGVIVTHMDTVKWQPSGLIQSLNSELGINAVMFSSINHSGIILCNDILKICKKKFKLSIDGENFFKTFKVSNNNMRILRSGKKQVDLFKGIIKSFYEQRQRFPQNVQADLTFEFQAWMLDQITEAQKRMYQENNFDFTGEESLFEAGHIANMTNQLRGLLYNIRIEAMNFAPVSHGVNEIRQCPHCGLRWAKVIGCNGQTTCGDNPDISFREWILDTINFFYPFPKALYSFLSKTRNNGVMATFTFQLRTTDILESFNVVRNGDRHVRRQNASASGRIGCGKTIEWTTMNTVPIPQEFQEDASVKVNDVEVVPR